MDISVTQHERRAASARGLITVLNFAASSHARAIAVLLLVSLLAFLPGLFAIPPIDRDEARFAQATKQMIETGDYVDIRFQDEVRYKKPVGIYWLQAGAVKAARALGFQRAPTTIWLYRIPSLAGAIGAVLLTYWAALAFVTRRAAILAALMMASSVLLGFERLLATTDAVLLMTIVAAMGAMARAYLEVRTDSAARWLLAGVFWTAVAAGVLIKGPMIVMVVGLAAVALAVLDRSGRWFLELKPIAGAIWFAVIVLPWFIAIIGRSGDAFLAESVGQDLLSKVFSAQEAHGAPPGYYFLLFWITFFPGAMLAGLAAPAVWASRNEPPIKFLLAWLIPSWLLLEMIITKLPHYVLPLYPAIAILIAGVVERRALSRTRWLVWGTMWWFVLPVITGIGALVALAVIGRQFGPLAWPLIGGAAVLGLLAWRLYEADGAEHSLLRAAAASVLMSIAVFSFVVPALGYLFPAPALARLLQQSGCSQPLAAAAGYEEPSLVFLAGTGTQLTDSAGAAEFLRGGECRFALIESRHEKGFAQRAEAVGLRYTAGPRVEGLNFSTGQPVTIAVFRSREGS